MSVYQAGQTRARNNRMADKKSAEETGRALCAAAQVGDLCETEDLLEAGADALQTDAPTDQPCAHEMPQAQSMQFKN